MTVNCLFAFVIGTSEFLLLNKDSNFTQPRKEKYVK